MKTVEISERFKNQYLTIRSEQDQKAFMLEYLNFFRADIKNLIKIRRLETEKEIKDLVDEVNRKSNKVMSQLEYFRRGKKIFAKDLILTDCTFLIEQAKKEVEAEQSKQYLESAT